MLIFLYIFLGLLVFDCLIACRLYFLKERSPEGRFHPKKIEKSNEYGKTAKKGDRTLGVFSPIISTFYFRLK